jgi:predicted deacylase
MTMPVHVIHGRRAGPRLFVCAAIHGDEIIGIEIIRRLLKLKKIKHIQGTLLAVPVVNVYAFIQQSRYSPDRRDLNRFFPGIEKGSLTSRLADIFMDEIVNRCTHGIDLHAGSKQCTNLPQVRANLDDPVIKNLAIAFGAPLILNSNTIDGSLRQAAADKGLPLLLYEAGEALRFDDWAIRAGIKGVLSVMESIGMSKDRSKRRNRLLPLVADTTTWIRAPISGILQMHVSLGRKVENNAKIGVIADPFGDHEETIRSPVSGMVIGRLNMPLVHQGDAIINVAQVKTLSEIKPVFEAFQNEITSTI